MGLERALEASRMAMPVSKRAPVGAAARIAMRVLPLAISGFVLLMRPIQAADLAHVPLGTPEAIIAYAFFISNYPKEFSAAVRGNSPGLLFEDLARLDNSLASINPDIPTALAFNQYAFIVQSDRVGQVIGFGTVTNANHPLALPDDGILFVTSPIKALNYDVLMILSAVRPDRTWILEVSRTLDARLIFESFGKTRPEGLGLGSPVGSIYQIRVSAPDVFLLSERPPPAVSGGGPGSPFPARGRTFELDASKKIQIKSPLKLVDQLRQNP